jgi:hypothetical protein
MMDLEAIKKRLSFNYEDYRHIEEAMDDVHALIAELEAARAVVEAAKEQRAVLDQIMEYRRDHIGYGLTLLLSRRYDGAEQALDAALATYAAVGEGEGGGCARP